MIEKLFDFDESYKKDGIEYIVGTDEAGRGPGAGPVMAAAVCFKMHDEKLMKALFSLNDSKQLSENTREKLYDIIINSCIYSVAEGSVEDIEKKNILNASLDSMKSAVIDVAKQLKSTKIKVLIDGNKKIKNFQANMETVVKGDAKSAAIAAASILAKVTRDRFMKELDKEFPQYHWAKNKGYLSPEHIDAIKTYGVTKWHRRKFLRNILEESEQLSLI